MLERVVPDDPLRKYVAAKQAVAEAVLAAQPLVDRLGASTQRDYQALLAQLADDRFNLVVVGQFKRGKSSLMNAVIGRDLLPTGVLPLTSAITTLCYGPEARAVLQFEGWRLEAEIPLGELPDYVTERGNPGNAKRLAMARVEVPVPFLKRGLYFIDTPGIGSTQAANTQTTYAFLPQADAVVWVTSVEGPLTETEADFVSAIRQQVRKLFVVVNKIDLLADAERPEVLSYLRSEIERLLASRVALYPVSARQALQGKLARDTALFEASGLGALERDLAVFLASERPHVFLLSVVERALRLLPPESPRLAGRPDADAAARQALEALQAELAAGTLPQPALAASAQPLTDQGDRPPAAQPSPAPAPGWLPRNTCPICDATLQAVFDFHVRWQSALARSPEARRQLAAARGFCDAHTWQLAQIAAPQDLSQGLAPLLEASAAGLRRALAAERSSPARAVAALLPDASKCAACQVQRETERQHLAEFLQRLAADDQRRAYAQTRGLCLPHLAAALVSAPSPELSAFLLQEQAQRLETVAEDMRNFALRRAALRRGLINRDEERAWLRGVKYLVGEQNARALAAVNGR